MANIKSAKKRIRVAEKRNARNKAARTQLRTILKKVDLACESGSPDQAQLITYAIKKVDQACAKGLMHKNTASRKKSQLAKRLPAKTA